MYYSSTKYDSLMNWVFSVSGVVTILVVILAIWLIYNYFTKNQKKEEPSMYYRPPINKYGNISQYNNEFGSDNSIWEDVNKSESTEATNIYPTREEEPIPPNAVSPSSYFAEKIEFIKLEDAVQENSVENENIIIEKKENE